MLVLYCRNCTHELTDRGDHHFCYGCGKKYKITVIIKEIKKRWTPKDAPDVTE